MASLQWLDGDDAFPPTTEALDYPNGLLAAGGDLSPRRLLQAYQRGIFPWYEDPQPILWWSPDPRSVLLPEHLHLSRSLRKTLRQGRFRLSLNRAFEQVMQICGASREQDTGTWISPPMLTAYAELHRLGYAHSIEVYDGADELVGGLYGVALGGAFFGESMFSRVSNASKVALVALVWLAKRHGIEVIDCQVESAHLNSLGARTVSRQAFEALLAKTVRSGPEGADWTVPKDCGDLL